MKSTKLKIYFTLKFSKNHKIMQIVFFCKYFNQSVYHRPFSKVNNVEKKSVKTGGLILSSHFPHKVMALWP